MARKLIPAMYNYPEFKDLLKQGMGLDALEGYRAKLAKRANQRIRTLEKKGHSTGNLSAVANLHKRGRTRFYEGKREADLSTLDKVEKEFNRLQREINELHGFLGSKQTTISGRNEIFEKTAQTFQAKGINIKPDVLKEILKKFDKFRELKMRYETAISNLFAVADEVDSAEEMARLVDMVLKAPNMSEADLRKALEKHVNDKRKVEAEKKNKEPEKYKVDIEATTDLATALLTKVKR